MFEETPQGAAASAGSFLCSVLLTNSKNENPGRIGNGRGSGNPLCRHRGDERKGSPLRQHLAVLNVPIPAAPAFGVPPNKGPAADAARFLP
jgi:hypothetical protein